MDVRHALNQLVQIATAAAHDIDNWSGWNWQGWAWQGWVAVAGIGTVAAVVVALLAGFGKIGARARLEAFVDDGPPGKISIKTSDLISAFQSYYCRLRIANNGSAEAEGVEVQMLALRKKVSGQWTADPVFLPLDLKWSFDQEQRPRLLPGVYRFCDLIHVDRWDAGESPWLVFHTSMYPAFPNELEQGEWPTLKAPGEYELDIAVAGVNAKRIRRTIYIKFDAIWHDDPDTMFKTSLVVRRR